MMTSNPTSAAAASANAHKKTRATTTIAAPALSCTDDPKIRREVSQLTIGCTTLRATALTRKVRGQPTGVPRTRRIADAITQATTAAMASDSRKPPASPRNLRKSTGDPFRSLTSA